MAVQSATITRITRTIRNLQEQLDELALQKEETLDNESSKDSPNEERMDKYQEQLEHIQEASGMLDEVVEELECYE